MLASFSADSHPDWTWPWSWLSGKLFQVTTFLVVCLVLTTDTCSGSIHKWLQFNQLLFEFCYWRFLWRCYQCYCWGFFFFNCSVLQGSPQRLNSHESFINCFTPDAFPHTTRSRTAPLTAELTQPWEMLSIQSQIRMDLRTIRTCLLHSLSLKFITLHIHVINKAKMEHPSCYPFSLLTLLSTTASLSLLLTRSDTVSVEGSLQCFPPRLWLLYWLLAN